MADDESVTVTHSKQCKQTPPQCFLDTYIVRSDLCIYVMTPILHFEASYRFRDFVDCVWRVIQATCFVETNTLCSTHAHISPDNNYTIDQVKFTARAILSFESALNAPVPIDRLKSRFCKSFYASNSNFKGKPMERCIAPIEVAEDDHRTHEQPRSLFRWNLWYGCPLTVGFWRGGPNSRLPSLVLSSKQPGRTRASRRR